MINHMPADAGQVGGPGVLEAVQPGGCQDGDLASAAGLCLDAVFRANQIPCVKPGLENAIYRGVSGLAEMG